jgi:hypothetical protein
VHFQQHDLPGQRPDARGAQHRQPHVEPIIEGERAETDHAGSKHRRRHAAGITDTGKTGRAVSHR